jgi:hypothetical protein
MRDPVMTISLAVVVASLVARPSTLFALTALLDGASVAVCDCACAFPEYNEMAAANDKVDTPLFRLIRITSLFPWLCNPSHFLWLSEEALHYAVSL